MLAIFAFTEIVFYVNCTILIGESYCIVAAFYKKIGRTGSGPEFHVNFGSGLVGSLHLWVGLGRVKKIGPMFNSIFM